MTLSTFVQYIWNTRRLAQAVGRNELPEHDQFALFLFGQIVLFVSGYGALISGTALDWISGVEISLLFLITVVGTVLVYRANGSGHGREFIRRFALLSVPLALKLGLLMWPVFYALHWVLTILTLNVSDSTFDLLLRSLEFSWNIVLAAAFFWRLVLWIKVTTGAAN
jgi:hypothetical protein